MEYQPSFVDQLDVDYISHHGILGQRWGVRRYQNTDGSLTPAGIIRYHRNKSLVNKHIRDIDDTLANNRSLLESDERELRSLEKNRNRTIDDLTRSGSDRKTVTTLMDVYIDDKRRWVQMGRELVESSKIAKKKYSEIDFSAQSYEKTKKMVDDIILEHGMQNVDILMSYAESKEYQRYLDYGGEKKNIGINNS